MRIAFIVDPLAGLKAYKDSSVFMMREAVKRGHEVHAFEAGALFSSGAVSADSVELAVHEDNDHWYDIKAGGTHPLTFFDAVLMRKDPPFDQEYLYSTLLLSLAEKQGARIINRAGALRDYNEKLAILKFSQFTAPTLVSAEMGRIHAFIDEHRDAILKKLDGMGGTSIFRVRADDPNRNAIVEVQTQLGTASVMAQKYLPAISAGDKRVLVIDGKVAPQCLARIPKAGETRGNLAAGGKGVAQPITARDREIAETLGPQLKADGLTIVGLDIIGDCLTEVNVTSPTCMVEIFQQSGCNVAAMVLDAIEAGRN
ncbi:MAG: glutathione synthase [Betaproteobacteria bacterium]|nr:glutathione synthase [Betaproteobacteria bacterium]